MNVPRASLRILTIAGALLVAAPVAAQATSPSRPGDETWPQAAVYLHAAIHLFGPDSSTLVHFGPGVVDEPAVCVSIMESVLRSGAADFEARILTTAGVEAPLLPILETFGAPYPDRLLGNTRCLPTRPDLGGLPAGSLPAAGDVLEIRHGRAFNGGDGDLSSGFSVTIPTSSLTYDGRTLTGDLGAADGASWVTAWSGADLVEDEANTLVTAMMTPADVATALADGSLDAPGTLWVSRQLSPGVWVDQVLAGDIGCDAVIMDGGIDRAPYCIRRDQLDAD